MTKLVIMGGVAAGMSAAARARRLSESAEIIVIERSFYVSFANCGLPYHIGGTIQQRDKLVLQTPESLAETLNLDVRIGHEVVAIDTTVQTVTVKCLATAQTYQESYDKLVLCPGAKPIVPNLPGIHSPRVLTLRNIEDMDKIQAAITPKTKQVVVIGGGYIGVEMAENLRARNLQVSLVEIAEQVMPPLDPEMARDLQYHMEYHGVTLYLANAVVAFEALANGLLVTLKDGQTLEADLVILSAGVRPDVGLLNNTAIQLGARGGIKVNQHMQTSVANVYAAGDAVEVADTITQEHTLIALAGPANRQGRIVADHIFGRSSYYTSTQGTAVLKVFEMTAGMTGASEKSLKRNRIVFNKIHLHPTGHASYYPGTHSMHIKLLYAPDSGQILGAQVVGYDGVDKRIDVYATAIRAGMTVHDLEHLELAYAPPYGSAKDAINMSGFIACNQLKGDIAFWYAEDYPAIVAGHVLIDVRSQTEYATWHIPEAVNIPLGQLRKRLHTLSSDQPILLYCRVGFRSYLAHRILVMSGFSQVRTLAGGSKTFCSFHRTPLCTGRPSLPFVAHAEEKLANQSEAIQRPCA